MRTVFYLSLDEYRDIKAKGLDLQVSGETFTIMVDGLRKLKVSDVSHEDGRTTNGNRKGKPFPQAYPEAFKARVLKYLTTHDRPTTAKKFKISTTTVRTWLTQKGGK